MASGNYIVLDKAKLNIFALALLSTSNTFKLSLHASSFSPNDTANEVYADLSGELATGGGYTAGGYTVAGASLTLLPAQTLSSITRTGQVATVTTAAAHGLSTSMNIPVSGASDPLYNGLFPITVTGATTFTYTMTGTPAANASGSLSYGAVVKFTHAAAQWTASGSGIPAWRNAYLRVSGTFGGKVDPLIGRFIGDATPADIPLTTSPNTLTVTPNAAGLLTAA